MTYKSNLNTRPGSQKLVDKDLVHLYGLSDFWLDTFQDSEVVQSLLGVQAVSHANLYSKVLQMFTGISLESMVETVHSELKLVVVTRKATEQAGTKLVYQLPESIKGLGHISNRPFLATLTLDHELDYFLSEDGLTITFSRPVDDGSFPLAAQDDGSVAISLWCSDVEIDEGLLYRYYGRLIGITPASATTFYKSYIQSQFFLRTQGPTKGALLKGVNLCVGIPLTRDTEEVLDVYKYDQTENWIVVTSGFVYEIPYKLPPTVTVGQVLERATPLAQWVEVKDFVSDGKWWVNLQMPAQILPNLPVGVVDRYISEGGVLDDLMEKFLKTNTFLVKIKVTDFKTDQVYDALATLMDDLRPSYTYPFYIWTVENLEEVMDPTDAMLLKINQSTGDTYVPEGYIDRVNSTNVLRGAGVFFRCQLRPRAARTLGIGPDTISPIGMYVNPTTGYSGGPVTGVHNADAHVREMSSLENGWAQSKVLTRTPRNKCLYRSKVLYGRGLAAPENLAQGVMNDRDGALTHLRVPLYISTLQEINTRLATVPGASQIPENINANGSWIYTLGAVPHARAENSVSLGTSSVLTYFDTLFKRSSTYRVAFPSYMQGVEFRKTFLPTAGEVASGDYIEIVRILDDTFAVYWRTTNFFNSFKEFLLPQADSTTLTFTARAYRGGHTACLNPIYQIRGSVPYLKKAVERNVTITPNFVCSDIGVIPVTAYTDVDALEVLRVLSLQTTGHMYSFARVSEAVDIDVVKQDLLAGTFGAVVLSGQQVQTGDPIAPSFKSTILTRSSSTFVANGISTNQYNYSGLNFTGTEFLVFVRLKPGFIGAFLYTYNPALISEFGTQYVQGFNFTSVNVSIPLRKQGTIGGFGISRSDSWGDVFQGASSYSDSVNPTASPFTRAGYTLIHKQVI